MDQLNTLTLKPSTPSFESLKNHNQYSIEYWSARDLQPCLGYSEWRKFENTIKKAMESCRQSNNDPSYHFVGADKPITGGKGAIQIVKDYHLSRFACYLIAQNGDSRKQEIADAQKYFAIQTRRQEISDQMAADIERLELRNQTKIEFKALSNVAKQAGVQNSMFGIFHDAGYKGLYAGLSVDDIKNRKGVAQKEQLMDRMGTIELAANQFRMTQTRDKLNQANIKNSKDAIKTHYEVGKEVRDAMTRIGGTLPENLPLAEPIKNIEKRIKSSQPRLILNSKDAVGIVNSIESENL